jgi:hypothetical protein
MSDKPISRLESELAAISFRREFELSGAQPDVRPSNIRQSLARIPSPAGLRQRNDLILQCQFWHFLSRADKFRTVLAVDVVTVLASQTLENHGFVSAIHSSFAA